VSSRFLETRTIARIITERSESRNLPRYTGMQAGSDGRMSVMVNLRKRKISNIIGAASHGHVHRVACNGSKATLYPVRTSRTAWAAKSEIHIRPDNLGCCQSRNWPTVTFTQTSGFSDPQCLRGCGCGPDACQFVFDRSQSVSIHPSNLLPICRSYPRPPTAGLWSLRAV